MLKLILIALLALQPIKDATVLNNGNIQRVGAACVTMPSAPMLPPPIPSIEVEEESPEIEHYNVFKENIIEYYIKKNFPEQPELLDLFRERMAEYAEAKTIVAEEEIELSNEAETIEEKEAAKSEEIIPEYVEPVYVEQEPVYEEPIYEESVPVYYEEPAPEPIDVPDINMEDGVQFNSGWVSAGNSRYSSHYGELTFSERDYTLMALMLEHEVTDCSIESIRAEVCILMNRMLEPRFDYPGYDRSAEGRLSTPNQYSGYWGYCNNTPSDSTVQIAKETVAYAQEHLFDFACDATSVCQGYSSWHENNCKYLYTHDNQRFYSLY